jgi:hypothetical protein
MSISRNREDKSKLPNSGIFEDHREERRSEREGCERGARRKAVYMLDMVVLRDFRDGVLYNAVIAVD